MSAIFLKLLNMSISASWLMLAVIIARLLLKKAPKTIVCFLWAFVAIRLIFPFSFSSEFSLIPSGSMVPEKYVMKYEPHNNPAVHLNGAIFNNGSEPSAIIDYTATSAVTTTQSAVEIISVVWLMGVIIILICALVNYFRLKRTVAASLPMRNGIMICDEVKSPFILGIIRPVIYLPSSLDGETAKYVIAHELAHLSRRDHWWKPLGFLLLSVYWFHPLCWVAYALFCKDIEIACDQKVIRHMNRNSMAAYSQALLDCSVPRRRMITCPLAFGEIGVKERVKGILNYRKPSFWLIFISVAVCAIVAVCFFTSPVNPKADEWSDSYSEALSEVNTQVAFCNYTDVADIYLNCLNYDWMYYSAMRYLPMYKFETKKELDHFKTMFQNQLTFDQAYDEVPSFNAVTADYDEEFFSEHTLIMVYVEANTCSLRYGVRDVSFDGSSLCVNVIQTNYPSSYDEMMAGWAIFAEFRKSEIKNCKNFNAAIVQYDDTVGALFDTIMSSPAESSNAWDYLNAHEKEHKQLLENKTLTLQYIFSEFLQGPMGRPQTGLKGYIMRLILDELAPDSKIDFDADGQEYFSAWKEKAETLQQKNGSEWMEKNRPEMYLLLQMMEK